MCVAFRDHWKRDLEEFTAQLRTTTLKWQKSEVLGETLSAYTSKQGPFEHPA